MGNRIKCECKEEGCKIGVYIGMEALGYEMWMYGPSGEEFQIYLTPNIICALLRDLKVALQWYTEPEEED